MVRIRLPPAASPLRTRPFSGAPSVRSMGTGIWKNLIERPTPVQTPVAISAMIAMSFGWTRCFIPLSPIPPSWFQSSIRYLIPRFKTRQGSCGFWALSPAARGRLAARGLPTSGPGDQGRCWTVALSLRLTVAFLICSSLLGSAMKQPVQRRLAAILAADVAGYSRLMGVDEEGTHERLKAHLRELVDPKIKEHRGRTVKNTGDGLLAEFPSVVDAVRCAVEVQRGMVEREPDTAENKRISFRIGINLGDVIAEEDDIFGDGVNIAARLEALAEPGGICISRTVREQIRDKLTYPFEDRGEQSVKNIARSVRVYAMRLDAIADLPASRPPAAASISQPTAAPRLSVVVLPFTNLSDDREQQYFADGITEDLTTDLSRIAHMFVISRNTAFTYRSKSVDTRQIGRELGVRYVLEGSVRRSGSQARINAQLIDAATGAHLWAERFDRETGDLFALQNEITGRLANTLGVELIAAEATRPTADPDALDYILRGRAVLLKPRTPNTYREAINLFEHALALDPQSVEAQSRLAHSLVTRVLSEMSGSATANIARVDGLVV